MLALCAGSGHSPARKGRHVRGCAPVAPLPVSSGACQGDAMAVRFICTGSSKPRASPRPASLVFRAAALNAMPIEGDLDSPRNCGSAAPPGRRRAPGRSGPTAGRCRGPARQLPAVKNQPPRDRSPRTCIRSRPHSRGARLLKLYTCEPEKAAATSADRDADVAIERIPAIHPRSYRRPRRGTMEID